jgi:hypothetical protein
MWYNKVVLPCLTVSPSQKVIKHLLSKKKVSPCLPIFFLVEPIFLWTFFSSFFQMFAERFHNFLWYMNWRQLTTQTTHRHTGRYKEELAWTTKPNKSRTDMQLNANYLCTTERSSKTDFYKIMQLQLGNSTCIISLTLGYGLFSRKTNCMNFSLFFYQVLLVLLLW